MLRLQRQALSALAAAHRESYGPAEPFPHVVLDDVFPPDMLRGVLEEFPDPDQIDWIEFSRATSLKLASRDEAQLGERTLWLVHQLNGSIFISFLEELTGISGLIPDPHLWGGGLHQIQRGGYLKVHADFNRHERLGLDRRLNLLLYLNEDWDDSYGGHLELWSRDMQRCERKILPVFNRCVVFSTTDTAYHGHPEPLNCPSGRTRRSIALYYYSNGRPESERSAAHSTLYQERPGERLSRPLWSRMLNRFKVRPGSH